MKVGSAVLGLHIAVACIFALTQGCVTTESKGSGRGAGARHKGPWKHEHQGKASDVDMLGQNPMDFGQGADNGMGFDPVIIDTTPSNTLPEPTPALTEVYIVQKGDMLSQLAIDFDTTVRTLVDINGLDNPDVLYVGQELRVPAGRRSPKTVKKKSTIKRGGTYVIQKGDTLSTIAMAAKVSIDDLRELNDLEGDKIFAGEKLSIPDYGKVPTKVKRSKPEPKVETAPPVEPAPLAPATSTVVAPSSNTTTLNEVVDHLVYPGETLDDIARQHGASKSEIMRMNSLTSETDVAEGMRLRIPIAE